MRAWIAHGFLLGALASGTGCGLGTQATPPVTVTQQELDVGCGMCRFHFEGANRCSWAISIEGTAYPVIGTLPEDHENHAPDGMCNVTRRAVVSGVLQHGAFRADRFELLPAAEVPANPRFTPADAH